MEGRQDLWTRTSRKPVAPFSTMAALGVFQGDICPLSSQSVPGVLCHPCPTLRMRELDFDTEPLCQKLESLQSELVKRMLKHLSNTAALTTLEVPTVRSRVLQRKLSFLHRVANSNPFSLSGRTVLALSQDMLLLSAQHSSNTFWTATVPNNSWITTSPKRA